MEEPIKFWETHAKEMRKARLLQAAAILVDADFSPSNAVDMALKLEKLVEEKLESSKSVGRD